MSEQLQTELRTYMSYLDTQVPPLEVDDIVSPGHPQTTVIAPVVPLRVWRQRGWVVASSAAVVVLLIGLLAFLARQSTTEAPVVTRPSPLPTVIAPDPVPTTVEAETAVGIVWTKTDLVMPETGFEDVPPTLVSDGDQFFTIIGGELARSVDGFVWDTVTIRNMPSVASLDWGDMDSASSKILLLDVDGSEASTVLIDVAAGEAFESILPFDPVGPVQDLRGFVALNDHGEAIALLYDLRERSMGETPRFYSPDGINWTRIPEGQLPDGLALQTAALGDGFVVTDAFDQPSNTYWHSPDGRVWESAEAEGTLPGSLVSWGDSAISYVESAFGPQAISANPAYLLTATSGTELVVDLAPLEDGGGYGPIVAAGGIGIVAITPVGPDPESWFVEYSPDGVVWVRQSLPFSNLNPFAAQLAANTDRVLIIVNDEVWVGTG